MVSFIVIVVVALIIKFFYDRHQQSVQIGKQGGMANKYRTLIDSILKEHQNSKIFQETSDSISLGVSSAGGTTVFRLLQTFGKLSVWWELTSPLFGKHKLNWEFPEFMNQEEMVERMANDLGKYQKNAIEASPYRNKF